MFKKLRNNFLKVNCAIIGALLIFCFGMNFLMIYQGVTASISRKLKNETQMTERRLSDVARQRGGPDGFMPDAKPRAEEELSGMPPYAEGIRPDFKGNPAFSPTFSVITDKNGTVTDVNMTFAMTEDFYSEKAAEIVSSDDNSGRLRNISSDGSAFIWEYRKTETSDGYIIAFTEISSELNTLRLIAICMLLIAAAAIVITVFISLFFANRSIKPIEDAYNKQKRFIADASHELKTPLTTINTNIDVLLSKSGSADDEDKKWLRYIKDEAQRMSKLTNDLLYLARAENGGDGAVLSAVSFTDAVKSVLLIMEARIFESEITLKSQVAEGVTVLASSEQLKQLVMILLDNAVKYTSAKGKIDVRLSAGASDARLTVTNTGADISEEDLPRIFDRFYRSDKARTRTESSGYGLGLAIAKALTESFKGSISAVSGGGQTSFTVKIPISK